MPPAQLPLLRTYPPTLRWLATLPLAHFLPPITPSATPPNVVPATQRSSTSAVQPTSHTPRFPFAERPPTTGARATVNGQTRHERLVSQPLPKHRKFLAAVVPQPPHPPRVMPQNTGPPKLAAAAPAGPTARGATPSQRRGGGPEPEASQQPQPTATPAATRARLNTSACLLPLSAATLSAEHLFHLS